MGRAIAITISLSFIQAARADGDFNFSKQLFGPPTTLSVSITSLNVETGEIAVNGVDTQGPTTPFTWDWGDGIVTQGFFPQQHTYVDLSRNYALSCTAHYSGGETDTAEIQVYFVAPHLEPISLRADLAVTIPDSDVILGTRLYLPPTLSHFDAAHFQAVPRSSIEYVLSVVASIQYDFVNADVVDVGGGFQQAVLRDPGLVGGGMYSLWFTDPVAFAAGDAAVQGTIEYSSFMHEMGHNYTLNTPATYYFGGKIDGNANAIYSETMAQIMQHSTAYELINNAASFGLDAEGVLVSEIKSRAISAMNLVRNTYDAFVVGGAPFSSWNDPITPDDETFGTFMTLAYKFCEHAEVSGKGYRVPLRRLIQLLQTFDVGMHTAYDQSNDSAAGATFRSTLMVAAISHGFQADLRSEFSAINFPIDNDKFDELIAGVPAQVEEACCFAIGSCAELTMDECAAQDGNPLGAGTDCTSNACQESLGIPALSAWGLIALALLVLTVGTIAASECRTRVRRS